MPAGAASRAGAPFLPVALALNLRRCAL